MKANLEEWADLLNLWPLVESDAERLLLSEHKKLASPSDTFDVGEVRYIQGKIEGMRVILAIPRRAVERLAKTEKQQQASETTKGA